MNAPVQTSASAAGLVLEPLAVALHEALRSFRCEVLVGGRGIGLSLGWEIFDDPHRPGKLLIVRWSDPAADAGLRLAGKLSAALRPQASGGVWIDCTSPFHGVNLRPAYQRQGVVGALLRTAILPNLPAPSAVLAPVGLGTAAGVALEFWRSYMEQRRGPSWLESEEGRSWWASLPENRDMDWDAAGGYPSVFALLRAVGLRQQLEEPALVLAVQGAGAPDDRDRLQPAAGGRA